MDRLQWTTETCVFHNKECSLLGSLCQWSEETLESWLIYLQNEGQNLVKLSKEEQHLVKPVTTDLSTIQCLDTVHFVSGGERGRDEKVQRRDSLLIYDFITTHLFFLLNLVFICPYLFIFLSYRLFWSSLLYIYWITLSIWIYICA